MRTLKFALAAVAAFAFNANAQVTGMQSYDGTLKPSLGTGMYQGVQVTDSGSVDGIGFHAGGVAACDGCHVMHNASSGVAKSTTGGAGSVAPWSNVTNMYLLQGGDQSSTCLICHSGEATAQFQVADVTSANSPKNYTPAGDFGWVRSSFTWTNSPAERHGHNVVAVDFPGLSTDSLKTAPGGTFTGGVGKAAFACSNCHDPHGRYRMQQGTAPNGIEFAGPFPGSPGTLPIAASGSYGAEPSPNYAVGAYRLLGGQRYAPASNSAYPFPNDPPVAVAPKTYNSSEATNEVRVAYGTGMSEWCQNCHTNVHLDGYTSGVAGLRHPAGSDAKFHAGQINVYNAYVSSGIVDATTNNYTSLVPFEQGSSKTIANLVTASTAANIIADSTSNVMCLSCHRAHASAFDSMVRWDQNATFLTNGSSGVDGFTSGVTNRTAAQTQAGYYGREVGTGGTRLGNFQRSLCNKCHGKD